MPNSRSVNWLEEVYLLGHVVIKESILVDPAKLEAILN